MAQFNVELQDDAQAVVDRVKTRIAQHGGRLEGDETGGTFEAMTPAGMLRGGYSIAGKLATIDIHDKPWTLPDSMIQTVLQEYFTKQA
jgi:hypothetical protein